jgi:hypothetical protein
MIVFICDGLVLGLSRPKMEHRCNNVQRVSNAADCLIRGEKSILTKRIMSLYKPDLIVRISLCCKSRVLQLIMQRIVQVSIRASENAARLF